MPSQPDSSVPRDQAAQASGNLPEGASGDAMPQRWTQDELKALVGQAALRYVVPGEIVGVGTGSTVNKFIDALASMKDQIAGAVSSSEASTERLRAAGIAVLDANAVDRLAVYIDGADEIDGQGYMVKGGGAALTREKIVAALAERFVCIADASKRVTTLGAFPVPVEIIPMAARRLTAQFAALGGQARVRQRAGAPLVTDNGQWILDVAGLAVTQPLAFETMVSQWPGVVTVGVFAHQRAQVCLLGTESGVQELRFD
jgi:ribose 5-phosphate isomerase A